MEKAHLLEKLNELIARYEQHRSYITRAEAQAATGKFSRSVIEKVILDHEIKAAGVAEEAEPLLPALTSHIAALKADRASTLSGTGDLEDQLQELELRAAIGEMTEQEFDAASAELRASKSSIEERVAAIDADLASLEAVFNRWVKLATEGGHYQAPAAQPAVQPPAPVAVQQVAPAVQEVVIAAPQEIPVEISVEAPVEEPVVVAPPVEEEPEVVVAPPPVVEEPVAAPEVEIAVEVEPAGNVVIEEQVGSYVSRTSMKDDLSSVFDEGDVEIEAPVAARVADEEIAIEAGEQDAVSVGLEEPSDVGMFTTEGGAEVDIDLGGEPSAPQAVAASAGGEIRRAMLLYQENTPEEQIYPFTSDVLTIGRGRENDIQIKNDSKVSRYHCRLIRRGNAFYIEDQKSSNGTLVNGEAITERRIFGGEEVIVGETFFRFRLE